jgi:predicted ATP-binding protein involved in virulence
MKYSIIHCPFSIAQGKLLYMRVEYVVIADFRGIGRFRLADTQDTRPIVFIGENGAGKSSMIEAINIALSHFTSRMRNPKASGKQIQEIDIRDSKPWCEISMSVLTRPGYARRNDFNWSVVKYRRGQERDQGSSLDMLRQQVQDMQENLRQPGINLPVVAYYPTNRRIVDVSVRPGADEASNPVDAYDAGTHGSTVDFQLFFQWFREREDAENRIRLRENAAYRDRALEAVRSSISELFPGFTELHVNQRGQSLELTKVEGAIRTELPFTQLSDGEKCGIALVADIARRLTIANPSLSNPLAGDGIVLIDEIELHLHPRWQRLMVPRLTKIFPNCQFIISTHSPQVLSEIRSAYVYLLQPERETNQGIRATLLDSLYGRDSNRLLEDVMGDHERPAEVQEALLEMFRIIDRGDLDGARKQREELVLAGLYEDEPVFAKADVLMRKKEILGH